MTDHDPTAIARELETLGEDPPTPGELSAEASLDDDVDVASVAALIALSEPLEGADAEPLSDMERARVWRKFEARRPDGDGSRPEVANAGGTSGRPWALIAAGLAAAAVAAFVIVRPGPDSSPGTDDGQHEMAMAMGEQARAGLQTLGVGPGSESARAHDMVAAYEARLKQSTNEPAHAQGHEQGAG